MLKKVLAVATLASALTGVAATPALAAVTICYTYDINVAGNTQSSNGEQCVTPA